MSYYKRYQNQEKYRPILDNDGLTPLHVKRLIGNLKAAGAKEDPLNNKVLIVPLYLWKEAQVLYKLKSRYELRQQKQKMYK